MTLRRRILLASLAVGLLFTAMLGWMAAQLFALSHPGFIPAAAAACAVGIFWWLVAQFAHRAVARHVDDALAEMHAKLEETTARRRRLEKQHILLEQFAGTALPTTHTLAEQATALAGQSLALAEAVQPGFNTRRLRNITEELNAELLRLAEEARHHAAQAELLQQDLAAIGQRQPKLATQLQQLGHLARQCNLTALNAAIETLRHADPTRGIGLLAQDIRQIGQRSETLLKAFEAEVVALHADARRGAEAGAPLAEHIRSLAHDTEQLTFFTDEQWAALDALDDGEISLTARYRVVEQAQTLEEHSAALRQSLEGLIKNLQLNG